VHAELAFGWDNSVGTSSEDMLEQLRVFVAHDARWLELESDIIAERDRLQQTAPLGTAELQSAAKHEVAAWEAIWQGEWERALVALRQAIDRLSGGKAPQRYAALLNYLAACIAVRLAGQTDRSEYRDASDAFYRAARAAGRGTSWLSFLSAPAEQFVVPPAPLMDPLDEIAMSGVMTELSGLGRPATFENEVAKLRSALMETEPGEYENALVTLGRLAGAGPCMGSGGADAAPDAAWIFGNVVWVAWEAKSDAKLDSELGAEDVRQAGGHLRYTATLRNEVVPGDSVVFVMSPQERVHHAARAVAEETVYLVRPSDVVELLDRLIRAWRTLRSHASQSLDAKQAAATFRDERALPTQWLRDLRQEPLRESPTTSDQF
jgi:hypothetical protein